MATLQDILLQQSSKTSNYQPLIQANPIAAQMQAQGAVNAGNIGSNYLNAALGSLNQGAAQAQSYLNPYANAGGSALNQALNLTGMSGMSPDQVLAQLQTSPAYQFNLQEQLGALDRSAAARGKLYSGQQLKAIQDRAASVASNEYQNVLNNTMGVLQQTSPFASQAANQQYNLGQDAAQIQSQIGDVLGNAELARSGALSQGLLGEASARVAQSTAGGLSGIGNLDPTVYGGASTSPWGSSLNSQSPLGGGSYSGPLGGSGGGSGSSGGGSNVTSPIDRTPTGGVFSSEVGVGQSDSSGNAPTPVYTGQEPATGTTQGTNVGAGVELGSATNSAGQQLPEWLSSGFDQAAQAGAQAYTGDTGSYYSVPYNGGYNVYTADGEWKSFLPDPNTDIIFQGQRYAPGELSVSAMMQALGF